MPKWKTSGHKEKHIAQVGIIFFSYLWGILEFKIVLFLANIMISYTVVLQSYSLIQFEIFLILKNLSYSVTFSLSLNNVYCVVVINHWLAIKSLCMKTRKYTRLVFGFLCFVLIWFGLFDFNRSIMINCFMYLHKLSYLETITEVVPKSLNYIWYGLVW